MREKVLALALLLYVAPAPLSESLDRYVADPIATVRSVAATQSLSALNSSLRRGSRSATMFSGSDSGVFMFYGQGPRRVMMPLFSS